MDINKILDKIHALFAVANHHATGQAEAENAQFLAQQLITKYQIHQAQIDGHDPRKGDIECRNVDVVDPYARFKAMLLHYIAKHNICKVLRGPSYCMLIGYSSDIDLCLAVYDGVCLHMIASLHKFLEQSDLEEAKKSDLVYSFFSGYCIGIGERLADARDQAAKESNNGMSLDILLRDRMHAVEEFFQNIPTKPKSNAKSDIVAHRAYMSGLDQSYGAMLDRNAEIEK